MTVSETESFQAMLAHHRELEEGVARRVAAVRDAHRSGEGAPGATRELVAFLAGTVLPHAAAEERSVYAAAAARAELAATIEEMTGEHEALAASVARLAGLASSDATPQLAAEIQELFASHVARENEVVLPALLADPGADLSALLAAMHGELGSPARPDEAGEVAGPLVALLLEATEELAASGRGERACSLAAAAWVACRRSRPDLAARLGAALHRLSAAAPARAAAPGEPEPGDLELDVRPLAPAERHRAIFAAFDRLAPGTGFVLVNDHEPRPVRYQLEAEHPGEFTWADLETGPRVWRVRIGRAGVAGSS